MAVMNMPDEMVVVWKHVFMMYAPSFFSVPFFGSLPHARHRDCKQVHLRGQDGSLQMVQAHVRTVASKPSRKTRAGPGIL